VEAMESIESKLLPTRMRGAVSLAWSLFARKVGGGLLDINKEASMQLHFGYILQQILPLITFQPEERLHLELEPSAKIDGGNMKWMSDCLANQVRASIRLRWNSSVTKHGRRRAACAAPLTFS
jgi:hypothetical protein